MCKYSCAHAHMRPPARIHTCTYARTHGRTPTRMNTCRCTRALTHPAEYSRASAQARAQPECMEATSALLSAGEGTVGNL
eukprot:5890964-Pleurochrysis_carterae.AAC.1